MFQIEVKTYNSERKEVDTVEHMGKGMRSIYMLSLLETYIEGENRMPSIVIVEYPELFLHPRTSEGIQRDFVPAVQEESGSVQHPLPQLLLNFTNRQIRQVVLDDEYYSIIRRNTDIGEILDDLGYGAADAMNVDFVFIVEGKQDKSRLPLLLEKYYSEVHDSDGTLSRIAIITTNSCTNIKTYANLKYMNQVYLKGPVPDDTGR